MTSFNTAYLSICHVGHCAQIYLYSTIHPIKVIQCALQKVKNIMIKYQIQTCTKKM